MQRGRRARLRYINCGIRLADAQHVARCARRAGVRNGGAAACRYIESDEVVEAAEDASQLRNAGTEYSRRHVRYDAAAKILTADNEVRRQPKALRARNGIAAA